jgi:hypothetical protein
MITHTSCEELLAKARPAPAEWTTRSDAAKSPNGEGKYCARRNQRFLTWVWACRKRG